MKRTLITSALPYANGYIHLGHASGAYLPADIFARYKRLTGGEVLYICGSDEHGVAINISAEKEKVTPKQIIDKYHNSNKESFEKFGISFDFYSRTSDELHHETAREFFADFLKKGYLVEKEEDQFYDPHAKMFLPDRYVEGECPNCGKDKARGDQCDNCGAYYNQTELKNPLSTVTGKTPEVRKTTHWYMQFQKMQGFLENYLDQHEKDWKDNVVQQTRSWLKQGMAERAITRDLNWGIKVSGIPGIDDDKAKGKVLYVWFDAVLGYISITKQWAAEKGKNWEGWWRDKGTRYLAFIGKDNIVFHTLIFPAYLHIKGGYILPDNVPANEFLNLEGQKFSKSRNWSIDLKDFLADFPDGRFVDALRYSLAMSFPETRDSDFTWKDFQARNNNELAAIFGNFVNRTLQFLNKNFEGKVPRPSGKYTDFESEWKKFAETGNLPENSIMDDNDKFLLSELAAGADKARANFEKFRFRDAVSSIMNIARAANKYFNDEEPWKTNKTDPEKSAKTLYACCQMVASLSVYLAPVLPNTCKLLQENIGIDSGTGAKSHAGFDDIWNKYKSPSLVTGTELKTPDILFGRIEDDVIEAQMQKLGSKDKVQDESELITIDDFMKVKLRTAKIISAEKVKKSKKLLQLQVDLGDEKRQILAGVAQHYEPEYLVGKIIVVVANLKPAKLMGRESQGMMLAASTDEGKLCFVTPECSDVGEGAEVR